MGNSKRDKVDAMIRRAVDAQLRESAYYSDELRAVLRTGLLDQIKIGAACNVSGDPYRMKELADIMAWKKPPKEA